RIKVQIIMDIVAALPRLPEARLDHLGGPIDLLRVLAARPRGASRRPNGAVLERKRRHYGGDNSGGRAEAQEAVRQVASAVADRGGLERKAERPKRPHLRVIGVLVIEPDP